MLPPSGERARFTELYQDLRLVWIFPEIYIIKFIPSFLVMRNSWNIRKIRIS